jgi:hypothetical protein
MENCSLSPLSIERRRLQRAACITTDTASLAMSSTSPLSKRLQEAFFTGTVFTMIMDSTTIVAEQTTSLEQLEQAKATVKRTLYDLYSGADLVQEHDLDALIADSGKLYHGDVLFTFDEHQMLYHAAAVTAMPASQPTTQIKRRVRTPDYDHLSCAHLR